MGTLVTVSPQKRSISKTARWLASCCRFATLVEETGESSWWGGKEWLADVSRDLFVHFTTRDRAAQILGDGMLGKSEEGSTFAVSATYGIPYPEVQTTHIGPDESLVAIVFSTSAKPKVGYGEEVVWEGMVPLENPEIISLEEGMRLLKEAPTPLHEDDIVVYESQAWTRKNCAFAEADPTSFGKREWIEHKFPGKTMEELYEEENYDALRKARSEWERAMLKAYSLGRLSPEEIEEKKLWMNPGRGPLPSQLFHVTTAKDVVVREGVKSRDELSQDFGAGLGGGPSNTISFTDDLDTAKDIKRALLEAKNVASGNLTVEQMVQMAEKGSGTRRPWMHQLKKSFESNYLPIEQLIQGVKTTRTILPKSPEQMEGWTPVEAGKWSDKDMYTQWARRMTPEEKTEYLLDFYNSWATFRESAGGAMNPMFFLNDPVALANVLEDQIAILQYAPKPGAMGHKVSALGEWRTYSGEAVDLVGVVE